MGVQGPGTLLCGVGSVSLCLHRFLPQLPPTVQTRALGGIGEPVTLN